MKIVHVVYSLEMGGAEVLVAQLCRAQRDSGHDVSVCAYSKLGPIGEQLASEGFSIYVPGQAHPARTNRRYLAHFRGLRPEVVHCHNPAPTLQAAIPARLAGTRCVLATRHSLVAPPYERKAEIKFNVIARLACHWIAGICEITCENLRHTPFAPSAKIVRVYNGVPPMVRVPRLQAAASLSTSGRSFTLLFVGRLAEIKDLKTLLRALSLALPRLPHLRLSIVGDGPVRAELEALSLELNLTHAVRFWGQQMQTAEFFSAADCFVMSSISEGLPMSLLQAMSLGLPSITTEVGGMAEVLRLGQCGLMAPVGDAQTFSEKIVQLALDAALGKRLSTNALTAYHQHFTLEQMNTAYLDLYRRPRA